MARLTDIHRAFFTAHSDGTKRAHRAAAIGATPLLGATWLFFAGWLLAACDGSHSPIDASVADGSTADGSTADGFSLADSGADALAEMDAGSDVGTSCVPPGSYRFQEFESGGETRTFFLHVPAGHTCGETLPLWIDLHGTATVRPEEAYGLEAITTLADEAGVLVVRPRSRSSAEGDLGAIYRWDQNPGDLERNADYIVALANQLMDDFDVESSRVYVSGFSSGSNMTGYLLSHPVALRGGQSFAGFGFVAGGFFSPATLATVPSPLRVYASTGFRDYLYDAHVRLLTELARIGVAPEFIMESQTDAGHDLYSWHFTEMLNFFEVGERPVDGPLRAGWNRLDVPTTRTLLSFDVTPSGDWLVTGDAGLVLRRSEGEWSTVAEFTEVPAITDVCTTPAGLSVAVGHGWSSYSDDSGSTWSAVARVPNFGTAMFPQSRMNAVSCSDSGVMSAGYWSAGVTTNGSDWSGVSIVARDGAVEYPAQLAGLAHGALGTDLAVGYYRFIGRRELGGEFDPVLSASIAEWYLDVDEAAEGIWIVVGDSGTILRSDDDGATFTEEESLTEEDLYAVDVMASGEGLAVGRLGRVLRTLDGGQTWADVSPGVTGMLGDVRMLGPGHAVVVGEDGLMLELTLD